MTHHTSEDTGRKWVCIVGMILWFVVGGVLIYLCIYLTRYSPNDTTTMTSANSNNPLMFKTASTKEIQFTSIPFATNVPTASKTDDDNDTDDDTVDAVTTTFKKATIPPTLTRVDIPSLTRVDASTKPIKKVIHISEQVTLQNVIPPT